MKAVSYHRHGDPVDVLTFGDVGGPPPPGPNEVSVRILKRMIHPIDELLIRGLLPAPIPPAGAIPGGDGMGVVEQVGAGVDAASGIVVGARVILFPAHGTWADRIVLPAASVMPVPDDVSDRVACQIAANGITATTLLRTAAAAEGQAGFVGPLLVTAAGSSVGRSVIALGRMRRLKVIAVVRSDAGAALLERGFSGLHVVSTEQLGWQSAVAAAFGEPPTVVLDPVGGDTTSEVLGLMANRGTLLAYGGLDPRPSPVSTIAITARELTIKGVVAGSDWAGNTSVQQRRADVAELFEMTRQAPQNFDDCREVPLADAAGTLAAVQIGPRRGATILASDR